MPAYRPASLLVRALRPDKGILSLPARLRGRVDVSRTRGWTMPSFSWPGPGPALLAGRVLSDVRLARAVAVLTITIMLTVMISVRFGR